MGWFNKKNKEVAVKKSAIGTEYNQVINFLINANTTNRRFVSSSKALFYYDVAAPVSTAIDLINDEFKSLDLALDDKGDISTDNDLIRFLQHPNDDMVLEDFLESMGAYFLVTGECYIIATGNINRPPAELIIVSPEDVEVRKRSDGFIDKIFVERVKGGRIEFKRSDDKFRFYNYDQSAEIWQIKNFNTQQTGRGRSKLSSISYEIDQYIETSIHNLNLLSKGMRPSGNFTSKEPLSDDQFERLKEQIDRFYAGGENAGNALVTDGDLEFKELSINPKDMDFGSLKSSVTTSIFNRYKVPLPLVNPDKMTLSNLDSARLTLYDNVVLPLSYRLFAELTFFLKDRFKLADGVRLVPFLDSITALQIRRNEELKLKKEIGVLTINKLRSAMGEDKISEGGDVVYIANNLVPAGKSATESNPVDQEDQPQQKTTRSRFIEIMKMQKDHSGQRKFSDEEINDIADKEGLV